jgi:hypothetical protein
MGQAHPHNMGYLVKTGLQEFTANPQTARSIRNLPGSRFGQGFRTNRRYSDRGVEALLQFLNQFTIFLGTVAAAVGK